MASLKPAPPDLSSRACASSGEIKGVVPELDVSDIVHTLKLQETKLQAQAAQIRQLQQTQEEIIRHLLPDLQNQLTTLADKVHGLQDEEKHRLGEFMREMLNVWLGHNFRSRSAVEDQAADDERRRAVEAEQRRQEETKFQGQAEQIRQLQQTQEEETKLQAQAEQIRQTQDEAMAEQIRQLQLTQAEETKFQAQAEQTRQLQQTQEEAQAEQIRQLHDTQEEETNHQAQAEQIRQLQQTQEEAQAEQIRQLQQTKEEEPRPQAQAEQIRHLQQTEEEAAVLDFENPFENMDLIRRMAEEQEQQLQKMGPVQGCALLQACGRGSGAGTRPGTPSGKAFRAERKELKQQFRAEDREANRAERKELKQELRAEDREANKESYRERKKKGFVEDWGAQGCAANRAATAHRAHPASHYDQLKPPEPVGGRASSR